jgi:hypothetical protein
MHIMTVICMPAARGQQAALSVRTAQHEDT